VTELQGHNFAVPGGISPKISKDLPGILATPPAKFTADNPVEKTVTEPERRKTQRNSKINLAALPHFVWRDNYAQANIRLIYYSLKFKLKT